MAGAPAVVPPPTGAGELKYRAQDSPLTLREGLDEYYAANPGLLPPVEASTASLGTYLNNHDVSHVVFGTDTSLRGEMVQDLWTFLAIDVSSRRYVQDFVREDEGKEIMKSAFQWETVPGFFWLLGRLPTLLRRSRRMPRKWTWDEWQPYLEMPLAGIREEFGIRVL